MESRQHTSVGVTRAVVMQQKKKQVRLSGFGYTANTSVNGARNILSAGIPFQPVEGGYRQTAVVAGILLLQDTLEAKETDAYLKEY